jgi:hypothetical protein
VIVGELRVRQTLGAARSPLHQTPMIKHICDSR